MMHGIVGDQDQIGRRGAREVAGAPRVHLDHAAVVLDLHARVDDGRDVDIGARRPARLCTGDHQTRKEQLSHTRHIIANAAIPDDESPMLGYYGAR